MITTDSPILYHSKYSNYKQTLQPKLREPVIAGGPREGPRGACLRSARHTRQPTQGRTRIHQPDAQAP